jgi:16S rRNA (uracil1498-N3)-methyltransferase
MGSRFFVETPITSDRATLRGSEAHHLQHVMRAVVGEEITLFDGSGKEFTGRVARIDRSCVHVVLTRAVEVCRESAREVIVGVALPKADRQRWLFEKLTEIGVARVVPLRTERSLVHPDQRSSTRLRRFVIEASKQCGRNQLMQVAPLSDLRDFLTMAPKSAPRWIADPAGERASGGQLAQTVAYVAVGPEGGFSEKELRAATTAGWQPVSLGPRTLRVETACAVLATLVSSDLHEN